jgi:hypothetical protein
MTRGKERLNAKERGVFRAAVTFLGAILLPGAMGCGSNGTSDVPADYADAALVDGTYIYNPPPLWSGGAPVLVAGGQDVVSLSVSSSNIFWQDPGGSVYACGLEGCGSDKPTQLSSLVGSAQGSALQTLTAEGDEASFLSEQGDALSNVALSDPDLPTTLFQAPSADTIYGVISDASQVYFVDDVAADNGCRFVWTLYSCPRSGVCKTPRTLYALSPEGDGSLGPLAIAGGEVYVVDSTGIGAIRAIPTHGGAAREVCSSSVLQGVQAIAIAGGYVYFTVGLSYSEQADPHAVYQCVASGGRPPSMYVRDIQPYALATDGKNLYWANYVSGAGSVVTCALGVVCTSPYSVADGQDSAFALTANAKSVYWSTSEAIYRADR